MPEKSYNCIVCKKEFTDTFKHALEITKDGFYRPIDGAHSDYWDKVVTSGADETTGEMDNPCYCGGVVSMRSFSPTNREISCANCELVYKED